LNPRSLEIIARAAVSGVRLSVNELNGRLHAEGRGSTPKPLMDRVSAMRDQLVFELTQGAQARLELARERHRPLLDNVERRCPSDVSGGQWQTAMDGLWVFLAAGYGDEALRLGWPHDELFAVPPLWSRVDLCGAGLLIGDGEVISITSSRIGIRTPNGSEQGFYRKPTVDYALVVRERLKQLGLDAGKEEFRLRAVEHAVNVCRANTGLDLESAKKLVLTAINSTKETTTP
jgi:hypothetical protein